jgi:uncharacterized protein YcbX
MSIQIGTVAALFRYPVKSMAGEALESASAGWHGIDGDRRLALRRLEDRGGFPWLTASRLPELVLYRPERENGVAAEGLPTHVRTPAGESLPLFGPDLAADISRRHGAPLEMMHLDRGIFDEASLSVIAASTIDEIARLSAVPADVRRFRPNIVIAASAAEPRLAPFQEERWLRGQFTFGDDEDRAIVAVTNFDVRCAMVNIDPDSARLTPSVLKAIVSARDNRAGVYAAVIRRGRIRVGQPVFFESPARG